MFLKSLILTILLAASALAQSGGGIAPPNVRVEIESTAGDGCPTGSITPSLSPDLASLTILFNSLRTDIPGVMAPAKAKSVCSLRLKFYFAGPYRIAVTGGDLRAFASIPVNAKSKISVDHFSPLAPDAKTMKKLLMTKEFKGPFEDAIQLTSNFGTKPLWSWCGTQGGTRGFVLMTVVLTIDSENNNREADLLTQIDSLDLNFNPVLKYNMTWVLDNRSCPKSGS